MDIEDCIEKIVKDGDVREMQQLSEVLEDVMELLEKYDQDAYKKYEMCIYKMAYGTILSKEMAEEIVSNMKPYRMRWDLEETRQIQQQYGLDNIRPIDFFVVLNSKYNDNKETVEKFAKSQEEKLEMYVSLAKDFIMDEDAKEDKVFIYYTQIPN